MSRREGDQLSSYERERLANIAQNEALLKQLGLKEAPELFPNKRKLQPPQNVVDELVSIEGLPPRRSARRLERPSPHYRDVVPRVLRRRTRSGDDLPSDEESDVSTSEDDGVAFGRESTPPSPPSSSKRRKDTLQSSPDELSRSWKENRSLELAPPSPTAPPGSIKGMDAVMLDEEYLGKPIPPIGGQVKGAVMTLAAGTRSVRFNKYSGIQEWRNAIFLFVNLDGSSYANTFHKDGRFISWFAQTMQRVDSPVIARMMARACPVLLFCREVGCPYICFGRVEYDSHVDGAFPIQFSLRLCDYEKLSVLPAFAEIVSAKEEEAEQDEALFKLELPTSLDIKHF